MKYAIGLDCGIASVGFSVVELLNDQPYRIIKLGSRIFSEAENPKDGSSLAFPRREARGNRRRLRRHNHRLERIRFLIIKEKILTEDELANLFDTPLSDIYQVRTEALDRPLSNKEFARVLINLAQRRGFKSNRKTDSTDKENGLLLNAISENEETMQKNGYRTVGEMFFKDEKYSLHKRNKGGKYLNTVSRNMIEDEADKIFNAQKSFGCDFASDEIKEQYKNILLSQRPFDLGPGEGPENCRSPYFGNQIEKMIGKCTFFPEEPRAAKATYSFQLFNLWQKINNIRIVSDNGSSRFLTDGERTKVFELCHKSPSVNYSKIRKELDISTDKRFSTVSYGFKEIEEVEKKTKFEYLKQYHNIRKALDKFQKGYIQKLSREELNCIGYALTVHKDDAKILNVLKDFEIDEFLYDYILNISSFSKFGNLSVKACDMLIPYLEKGLTYDKACAEVGFDFKAHDKSERSFTLPAFSDELTDITNPVVRRAVSQTIKVVNAIIREQGTSPTYINIELARELSKNFADRKDIENENKKNNENNSKIKEELYENFHKSNASGLDIVKLKLWREQDGICPYSQKPIKYELLFSDGYVDVDHIVPYSISFDDSYNNKVLVFANENRQKGNRLPLQYLTGEKQENFKVWVNANIKNFKKRQNLLKESISENEFKGFKERTLNDTKYLSRVLYNYINDHLIFEDFENGRKKHVTAVNGATTSYLRKRWGIKKIREDGDLHHAVDATVIACTTDALIQKVSKYSKYKELQYSENIVVDSEGEVVDSFPYPYPTFRKELEIRTCTDVNNMIKELYRLPNYSAEDIENIKPCFVSRMPNRKTKGAAHKDTIRSGKVKGYSISKVPLTKLKLGKDGEIENYYDKESDLLLYNALKKRLGEYDGNGKSAFADFNDENPFYKPKSDGTNGPIVKKVKIIEKSTMNVSVRNGNGIADNGPMVRIDVFHVENDGYYFVPIYTADTVKKELPNLACVAFKSYDEWKEMDDKDFCFSLYQNDLIRVTAKKDMKLSLVNKNSTLPKEIYGNGMFLYYNNAGISVAAITVFNSDGTHKIDNLGIKTLLNIEKFTVDPIGNVTKVNSEKRLKFNTNN